MEILKTKSAMQQWSKEKKRLLRSIGFVPTMGFLHQGHVSLMEKAKTLCDEVVLSIFVNPTQFGPTEDLDAYPSDLENDLNLARKAGVTAVFLPTKDHVYPQNFQTKIELEHLPEFLCGKFRPVHFGGVATVVTKLFNIVMPDVAVFGQKDYQQLQIIRQLTLDLDFDIKIVAGDIVREKDGLAMSSRNSYLSQAQRKSAISLFKSMDMAKVLIQAGETDPQAIGKKMETFIHGFDETTVEYISFCDPVTLEDMENLDRKFLLALAVRVGTTRLIDNCLMDPLQ